MAERLSKVEGAFLFKQREVAAINMVIGASMAGKSHDPSSSPESVSSRKEFPACPQLVTSHHRT
jgi:hypothetical protein